jgi:hypothetical protein
MYKLLLRLLGKRLGPEGPDEGVLITQRLRELLEETRKPVCATESSDLPNPKLSCVNAEFEG